MLKAEGDIYFQRGENANALALYEKALAFYLEAQSPIGQGNVYKAEGEILFHTGENAKALDMYEKALPFFEKAQEPIGQGNVYMAEGDVFQYTGEKARALAMYEKALLFYEKAQSPIGQGNVFQAEGDIFQYAGEDMKALATYEKALFFYDKAGLPIGQSIVYQREGDVYFRTGENAKALAMYEKALPIFEKAQEPLGQGNVFQREGEIYFQMGKNEKALAMYEKALTLFEKAQEPINQGYAYRAEGDVYFRAGEKAKALALFEKAISILERFGDPENLNRALFGKAGILAAQGRKTEALKLYEEALRDLEKVRAHAALPELKSSFMRLAYQDYARAAGFMLESGYPEQGFRVIEAMKARSFLDMLAESLVNVDKGLDPAFKERRDALMGKLSALTKAVSQAGNPDKLRTLKADLDKAQAEFDTLQTEIRLKSPAYAAVRYPEPVGLKDLQKVLGPHEVLVEYYLSEGKAFAFTLAPAAFKAIELPAGSKAIRSAVAEYLAWVGDPLSKPEDEPGRLAAGAKAFDLLIKPIALQIPEGSTLLLVPDDILARLPFESLILSVDPATKRPAYLLERYPEKYFQSASVLSFLRTQSKQTGVKDAFIGFGDPVYDYESFKKGAPEYGMPEHESAPSVMGDAVSELNKGRFAREGGSLKRLTYSGLEVREIADLLKAKGKAPAEALSWLRADATEENAKAPSMAGYGYIHFSCHGLLGDGFQSLVLSQIPGSKEDGFLTLGEIMNCTYNARLVVLSACETGKGKEERGEGVTGLTRAVMYAGTTAAVVSLWSVSDAATRDLMVKFYRYMIEAGLPKDEALRKAKLERLHDDRPVWISEWASIPASHPVFWAAFVIYGE